MREFKNIIVTGGCGFIGSNYIRHILSHTDANVLNIDSLTYASNTNNLDDIENSRYFFEKGDIRDSKKIKTLVKNFSPDLIVNFAAESHVDNSISNPDEFIDTNIRGTFNLIRIFNDHCQNLKENTKKTKLFHHISTDEVFGDLMHPADEGFNKHNPDKFSENTRYNPSSPYSASKASSDHLVRAWGRTYQMPYLITNCSNNYGPYQHAEKLIPKTILNAISGKKIPVYGKGDQIRDWLFVDDHCEALLMLAKKSNPFESYNIGGENELSNLDVVLSICSILDKNSECTKNLQQHSDLITFVEDRPGHDRRYAIDLSKIKKEYCWKPKESFLSGIEKTVLWYLNNLKWAKLNR